MELTEKWKLTTQNNANVVEGNQISKQNRYPCDEVVDNLQEDEDGESGELVIVFLLAVHHLLGGGDQVE